MSTPIPLERLLDGLIDLEIAIDDGRRDLDAAAVQLTEVQARLASYYASRDQVVRRILAGLEVRGAMLSEELFQALERIAERDPHTEVAQAIQRALREWVA